MAQVRFLGIVRDWMQRSSLEAEADTLSDVLQAMREKGGWRFEDKAFGEDGRTIPELEFLVNGRNARFLHGLDAALKPEDDVVVFIHRSWAEVPFM